VNPPEVTTLISPARAEPTTSRAQINSRAATAAKFLRGMAFINFLFLREYGSDEMNSSMIRHFGFTRNRQIPGTDNTGRCIEN
jgi:hypothetical protein